ncbi:MAG: hypothetical protein LW804_08665 [Cryomorphaceae bacterium]|nr:hypothetical protein [Cryomorphaceae bacterium]
MVPQMLGAADIDLQDFWTEVISVELGM